MTSHGVRDVTASLLGDGARSSARDAALVSCRARHGAPAVTPRERSALTAGDDEAAVARCGGAMVTHAPVAAPRTPLHPVLSGAGPPPPPDVARARASVGHHGARTGWTGPATDLRICRPLIRTESGFFFFHPAGLCTSDAAFREQYGRKVCSALKIPSAFQCYFYSPRRAKCM